MVVKLIINQCRAGVTIKLQVYRDTSVCLLCVESEEGLHINQCKDEIYKEKFDTSLLTPTMWLKDKDTPKEMVKVIGDKIIRWRENKGGKLESTSNTVEAASDEQT